MNDQTIPADKVREIIARHRDGASHRGGMILNDLKALLPTPPRPTLADMTDEERAACQWMQADVKDRGGRYVIANPDDGEDDAGLVSAYGGIEWIFPEYVTPRPDLPRLEWPSTEKPAPAPALPGNWRLADHEKRGRVIVTNPTPDSDGYVYFLNPSDTLSMGYDWHICTPDELTYLDQGADTADAVPPNTLDEGSEWCAIDALVRACRKSGRGQIIVLDHYGDAYVWAEEGEWWEDVSPLATKAPFTILHAGKKAEQ